MGAILRAYSQVVVDGRLVLLGLIIVLTFAVARDLEPARPAAVLARERAADAVLVEVNHAQQCRWRHRHAYADTVPSLLFTGGRFMRMALENDLDIQLEASADRQVYSLRVTGELVDASLERRGAAVARLEVGDRPAPRLAAC
jgi:hypothetical protein